MSGVLIEEYMKFIYLPLLLQFIIIIPLIFVFFCIFFFIIRMVDISIKGSKKSYYETSYDPLTFKRLLRAAFFCTGSLTILHIMVLFDR